MLAKPPASARAATRTSPDECLNRATIFIASIACLGPGISAAAIAALVPVSAPTFKHDSLLCDESTRLVTQESNSPMRSAMARHHPLLPFFAAMAGICSFSLMDATMKGASIAAGVYSALFVRNSLGAMLMLPVWLLADWQRPSRAALQMHALRSAVVAAMALLFFWGLVRVPLAEAIALSFIAPLIALYLAAVMLGETIQAKAIAASLLGLAGVLVIAVARLVGGTLNTASGWGIAAVLASAVLYAWNLILQRQQAQIASPPEIAFFQNLCVALILSLAAPWLLKWPAAAPLRHIALAAALAGISLLLLSWAYARAEAQALLPIEYTGFVWAALFGSWMFDEEVGVATLIGVALIVVGSWIAARKPRQLTVL
jgi:S-adenosylmethionine uptake transporter